MKVKRASAKPEEIGDLGITPGDLEWLEWRRVEVGQNDKTESENEGER